jgi:hypothetical protein
VAVACPTAGSIGSYVQASIALNNNQTVIFGSSYAAGSGAQQVKLGSGNSSYTALSGTWMYLGANGIGIACGYGGPLAICCRIA